MTPASHYVKETAGNPGSNPGGRTKKTTRSYAVSLETRVGPRGGLEKFSLVRFQHSFFEYTVFDVLFFG